MTSPEPTARTPVAGRFPVAQDYVVVAPEKAICRSHAIRERRVARLRVWQIWHFGGATSLAAVPQACPLNCISRAACLADSE